MPPPALPSARRFSAVSLFSGAGGLDVGLERTGRVDLRACVELVPSCAESLRTNRDAGLLGSPETVVMQNDLSMLDPAELMTRLDLRPGELDLLVGGPPCQSFSTAGRRRTIEDPRGTLLWDFLRFVDVLQPKAFVMENVRGLLSAALRHRPIASRPARGGPPLEPDEMPGSVIGLWSDDLAGLHGDYRVDCFEVNAVNYGAPQLRERVLLFGNRIGAVVDFPPPSHGKPHAHQPLLREEFSPFRALGDALEDFHEARPVVMDFSPRKKRYLAMVPPGGNWRCLPPAIAAESMGKAYHAKGGRSGWWRRLSWELPCPTIVTMPNHASTSMCHPDEVRALSVGECARVQGFPDGWTFVGTAQGQMTQIGNAVPVRLGEVAGDLLARTLDEAAATPEALDASVARFRRVYIKSHIRTRRWFRDGQAVLLEDQQREPERSAA